MAEKTVIVKVGEQKIEVPERVAIIAQRTRSSISIPDPVGHPEHILIGGIRFAGVKPVSPAGGGGSGPSPTPPQPTRVSAPEPEPVIKPVEQPEHVLKPTPEPAPTKRVLIPSEYAAVTRRVSPQETAYIPPSEPVIKKKKQPEAQGVLTTSEYGPGVYFKPRTRAEAVEELKPTPIESAIKITKEAEKPKRVFSGHETISTEETAFRKAQKKETIIDVYRKGIEILEPTTYEPDTASRAIKGFTYRLASAPADILETPRILEGRTSLGEIAKIPGEAVAAGISYAQKRPFEAGGALLADIALGFGLTRAYRAVRPKYTVTGLTGISTEFQESRIGFRKLTKPTGEPGEIRFAAGAEVDATPMIKTYTPGELKKTRSLTTTKAVQEITPEGSKIIARTTKERIVPETYKYTTRKKPDIPKDVNILEPGEAKAIEAVGFSGSRGELVSRRTTRYSRGYPVDLTAGAEGEFKVTRYRGKGSDAIKPFTRGGEPERVVSAGARARSDLLGKKARPTVRTRLKTKPEAERPLQQYKRTVTHIGYDVDYAYEPGALISPRAAGRVLGKEMGYPEGPRLDLKPNIGPEVKSERYLKGLTGIEPAFALKPKLGERLVSRPRSGLKQRPLQKDLLGEMTLPAFRQDIRPAQDLMREPMLKFKEQPILRETPERPPFIRPGFFPGPGPSPRPSINLVSVPSQTFKRKKTKIIDKKLRPGYSPSLLGLASGKTIKKAPKGVLTGLGIRYPVR